MCLQFVNATDFLIAKIRSDWHVNFTLLIYQCRDQDALKWRPTMDPGSNNSETHKAGTSASLIAEAILSPVSGLIIHVCKLSTFNIINAYQIIHAYLTHSPKGEYYFARYVYLGG